MFEKTLDVGIPLDDEFVAVSDPKLVSLVGWLELVVELAEPLASSSSESAENPRELEPDVWLIDGPTVG